MQVTETLNEGLKREIQVVIPKDTMTSKRDERLVEMKDKVKINGFRPGKVPMSHVSKMYGKSVMAELVNETIEAEVKNVLAERKEKAAQQPKVSMTEDEKEAEVILAGEQDFEFKIQIRSCHVMRMIRIAGLVRIVRIVPIFSFVTAFISRWLAQCHRLPL